MKGELLYTGSVKLVYQSTERADQVVFDFSDRISVFDKRIPNVVPQKGAVICGLASFWFERCQALGLRTHFVERLSPTEMLVERVDIERDYDRIQPDRRSVSTPSGPTGRAEARTAHRPHIGERASHPGQTSR